MVIVGVVVEGRGEDRVDEVLQGGPGGGCWCPNLVVQVSVWRSKAKRAMQGKALPAPMICLLSWRRLPDEREFSSSGLQGQQWGRPD
jgi:hypothetical protein